MTAIIGFAGPGYGLLAIDRNIVRAEKILSSSGGKLHSAPDGYFAGAGKAELLENVARRIQSGADPAVVGRAMRVERKSRYARGLSASAKERSFGVLLRKTRSGPELWVLRPEEGYRPEPVPAGRPLVTGPEDPKMRPRIGAFRMLFAPTPGDESLARNLDLIHLYFWLRHRLDPVVSADFDMAFVSSKATEMTTHKNAFQKNPERALEIAEYVEELGTAFGALGKLVRGA